MPIVGKKNIEFKEDFNLAVDANASSVTLAFPIKQFEAITLFVIGNSGAHTTHEIVLQFSPINTATAKYWHNCAPSKVTGNGCACVSGIGAGFVRAKVILAEGAASTVDIYIQVKS